MTSRRQLPTSAPSCSRATARGAVDGEDRQGGRDLEGAAYHYFRPQAYCRDARAGRGRQAETTQPDPSLQPVEQLAQPRGLPRLGRAPRGRLREADHQRRRRARGARDRRAHPERDGRAHPRRIAPTEPRHCCALRSAGGCVWTARSSTGSSTATSIAPGCMAPARHAARRGDGERRAAQSLTHHEDRAVVALAAGRTPPPPRRRRRHMVGRAARGGVDRRQQPPSPAPPEWPRASTTPSV